ncbi:MAG: ribosome-associated translation inhibitor RaiA [Acidobacteriia bacterium]|nr:ribosome-associated translation inhibitor RaiA [Terriglobia bacterium]
MRIDFTGRQIDVSPDLRLYTEERLRKLTRLLRDRFDVHVILTAEKHRRIAEITLKFREHTLVGVQETGDMRTSINAALDKLERQAVRLLTRRRTRKRRPNPATAVLLNVFGSERVDHEERRVLETERFPIKPMSVEDAIESLDAGRTGLVVFRNSDTERVNVLYRRDDGNLALIEPEP